MLKAIVVVLAVLIIAVAGGVSCSELHIVLVDETVSVHGGETATYWLPGGTYRVTIHSDDGVDVRLIGDVSGPEADATTYYQGTVRGAGGVFIFNPSGVFSNPTAIVHVKIVED